MAVYLMQEPWWLRTTKKQQDKNRTKGFKRIFKTSLEYEKVVDSVTAFSQFDPESYRKLLVFFFFLLIR